MREVVEEIGSAQAENVDQEVHNSLVVGAHMEGSQVLDQRHQEGGRSLYRIVLAAEEDRSHHTDQEEGNFVAEDERVIRHGFEVGLAQDLVGLDSAVEEDQDE